MALKVGPVLVPDGLPHQPLMLICPGGSVPGRVFGRTGTAGRHKTQPNHKGHEGTRRIQMSFFGFHKTLHRRLTMKLRA